VVPELSADNHLYHAQSWDWTARQEKGVFIIKIIQKGKPDILMLTEGGFIGKIGFNSQGIGLTLNAMSVPAPAEGVPLHVVMRGMLNSPTFVGAISKVVKNRCASAANLMVSTRDGEVLDIEIAGDDYDILYPDDGICVHSNHYLSERLKSKFKDLNRDSTMSTHMRRGRASRLLHSIGRPITRTDFENLFRDHAGYPDAICYHPDLYIPPNMSRGATLACIIMDMTGGVMYATVGRTCEQEFQFFKL
jgi:isopenicillin-N N-acyltransferase-like protein